MAKTKIAILGGGMAGLATAYQLSKMQSLRDIYEITVYQLGWRLGGKAASGRDSLARNLEHGLHVWFGCYENMFQMLREVYAARTLTPDVRFKLWTDAVKPQNLTPIGTWTGSRWTTVGVEWPTNLGIPGDGTLFPSLWDIVTQITSLLRIILRHLASQGFAAVASPPDDLLSRFQNAARSALHPESAMGRWAEGIANAAEHTLADIGDAVYLWSASLGSDPMRLGSAHPAGMTELLDLTTSGLTPLRQAPGTTPDIGLMIDAVAVFCACLRGLISDVLLPDRPLDSLDEEEFRAWLVRHGAAADIVADSSVVRLIYDTAFEYLDGDPKQPSCAAGTALGCCMRLVGTYKGAMMWELQGGMGETVVAPLYEALLAAGVKFEFFRKVTSLDLTPDGSAIAQVRIARQADTEQGEYRPTFRLGGLSCWPAAPDWAQLKNGEQMKAASVNFESHWCAWPAAGEEVLMRGEHFDTVVLAISLGAYKKLNDDPGICDALIARGGPFADFVTHVGIVPTMALQLWTDVGLPELGWTGGKAATVCGPEPLNIWADMSQILATEPWPVDGGPQGLHYLCGTYPTTLHRNSVSEAATPALALAEVRATSRGWLNTSSYYTWPLACDGHDFRWEMLTDPENRTGESRLDAQFWRANIDPTECCTMSATGTTKFRLPADGAGFSNLVLAGEGCRHGFNATAIEGAVMTGMAAARAIAGTPRTIVGYDFLTMKPSDFLM